MSPISVSAKQIPWFFCEDILGIYIGYLQLFAKKKKKYQITIQLWRYGMVIVLVFLVTVYRLGRLKGFCLCKLWSICVFSYGLYRFLVIKLYGIYGNLFWVVLKIYSLSLWLLDSTSLLIFRIFTFLSSRFNWFSILKCWNKSYISFPGTFFLFLSFLSIDLHFRVLVTNLVAWNYLQHTKLSELWKTDAVYENAY